MSRRSYRRQRGVSLVAAIFLLVSLASLVAVMGKLSSGQHAGSALAVQHSRAWFAARSGVDWAAWYLRSNHSCPPANTAFDLGQFRVAVSQCQRYPVSEATNSYQIFEIELRASSRLLSFGDPAFAARSLRASVIDQ